MRIPQENFDRLAKLAIELDTASDRAKEIIEEFESSLAATKLGVEVWLNDRLDERSEDVSKLLPTDAVEEVAATSWTEIGWSRVGPDWRVAYRRVRQSWTYHPRSDSPHIQTGQDPARPLTNGPRIIRIQAIPLLREKLLDELYDEACGLIAEGHGIVSSEEIPF